MLGHKLDALCTSSVCSLRACTYTNTYLYIICTQIRCFKARRCMWECVSYLGTEHFALPVRVHYMHVTCGSVYRILVTNTLHFQCVFIACTNSVSAVSTERLHNVRIATLHHQKRICMHTCILRTHNECAWYAFAPRTG
jgi:hypothetical protein